MKSKPLPEITPLIAARFWSHVDVGGPTECWPWTGSTTRGYGHFRPTPDGLVYAHRVAYQLLVGLVPEGLQQLDHLCRNRACCNPAHMEDVTARTNILRGQNDAARNHRKTHCKQGHPLKGINLHLKPLKNGNFTRVCLTCRRATQRALNVKYRVPDYISRRKS